MFEISVWRVSNVDFQYISCGICICTRLSVLLVFPVVAQLQTRDGPAFLTEYMLFLQVPLRARLQRRLPARLQVPARAPSCFLAIQRSRLFPSCDWSYVLLLGYQLSQTTLEIFMFQKALNVLGVPV